jgi:hypothetical protein
MVTSKLHPARFDTIFARGTATAAVDQLLHHAHVIVTSRLPEDAAATSHQFTRADFVAAAGKIRCPLDKLCRFRGRQRAVLVTAVVQFS